MTFNKREYYAEYRKTHKEQIAEQKAEYYKTHKEQIAEQKAEYYKTHKEQKAEYYKTHKEQIAEYYAEYYKTHNGKMVKCKTNHKRRMFKKNNNGGATLTLNEWNVIISHQNNKCINCGKKFNKTDRKPTKDCIIPLSKGGNYTADNVQALCKSCNSKKNNKIDKENILTYCNLNII